MSADTPAGDIDQVAIDQLKNLLKARFVTVLGTFLTNTAQEIGQIGALIDQNRPDQARFIAHRLGSGAAQFGLVNVTAAARALEHELGNTPDVLRPHGQALSEAFVRVRPALESMVMDI